MKAISTCTDQARTACVLTTNSGGCSDDSPFENPETALFRIDVILIPVANPEQARIVNRPYIFSDPESGVIAGLWDGGDHGEGTQRTRETDACHDITAYPEIGLAAGACSGNGILLDISDPVNPERIHEVIDTGLRLLALGDVQQRRRQGHLHRRMGRRRPTALPRVGPAELGSGRHLRCR